MLSLTGYIAAPDTAGVLLQRQKRGLDTGGASTQALCRLTPAAMAVFLQHAGFDPDISRKWNKHIDP